MGIEILVVFEIGSMVVFSSKAVAFRGSSNGEDGAQRKKVIIIEGGRVIPAIEACVRSAGGDPVLVQTQCFV
jgi:hypothetical protein